MTNCEFRSFLLCLFLLLFWGERQDVFSSLSACVCLSCCEHGCLSVCSKICVLLKSRASMCVCVRPTDRTERRVVSFTCSRGLTIVSMNSFFFRYLLNANFGDFLTLQFLPPLIAPHWIAFLSTLTVNVKALPAATVLLFSLAVCLNLCV